MGDSSSGSDIEEFSGIEQPPLLQQLKTILDEYRNDVQIIKELVQNADDAEATVMKILYEGRTINKECDKEKKYRRFLRAPALVFYNNAVFTDNDWRGIKAIYTSVKKDDPLKIGRFGLGFKSVFHLTDYPCIISGQYVLFINPHEKRSGKVCVTVKLKNLRQWKRLNIEDFMNAIDGTFEFSEKIIDEGYFNGTMFWFPLRQTPTELSEDVYKDKDVHGLLQAFIHESHRSLIFLKTLCSVEMFINVSTSNLARDSSAEQNETEVYVDRSELDHINLGKNEPFFTVRVDTHSNNLVEKRAELLKELKEIDDAIPDQSKYWVHDAQIETRSKTKLEVEEVSKARWLILNYLKGGKISARIEALKKDKDLLFPHLVGLAAPIHKDGRYSSTAGHVFCYQPLPQETSSVTGLPVHVNAFFSLTQNRRHIRWPDEDNQTLASTDKKIEWNMRLVSEILPDAYSQLIKEMTQLSDLEDNKDYLIKAVYNSIPDVEKVESNWKNLAIDVLNLCKLQQANIFHPKCCGYWLALKKIIVADFRPYRMLSESCQETVVKLMESDKVKLCILPDHVTDAFKIVYPEMNFVTPLFLRKHLMKNDTYKHLSSDEKQDLLEFVLCEKSAENLEGIELVPLADGSFCCFSNPSTVHFEEKCILDLFCGHEERFLLPDLRSTTSEFFQRIKDGGKHCIRDLTHMDAKVMLQSILKTHVDTLRSHSTNLDKWKLWVTQVWTLLQSRFKDQRDTFTDLEIYPVMADKPWDSITELCLMPLQSHFLYIRDFDDTEEEVRKAFQLLNITIVKYIPSWIDHEFVSHFIHHDTAEGLIEILSRLSENHVAKFNDKCADVISSSLLKFVSERVHTDINTNCKERLAGLRLFRAYIDASDFKLVSLKENCSVYNSTDFPIKFPFRVLMFNSEIEKRFADKLGIKNVSDTKVAQVALQSSDKYSVEDQIKLVNWIINHEPVFMDTDVQNKLKDIPFLLSADGNLHTPSNLFDPTDSVLQKLFRNQNVFPVVEEGEDDRHYIKALRILGLKSRDDISSDDITEQCCIVHQMALKETKFDEMKCSALLEVMNYKSSLVNKEAVSLKRCILAQEKENFKSNSRKTDKSKQKGKASFLRFPTEIKSQEYAPLIDSVFYTINTQELPSLSLVFGWSLQPDVPDVVGHLLNAVNNYDQRQKAKILQVVFDVYDWLSTQDQCSVADLKNIFNNIFSSNGGKYIWVGDGFQAPERVYLQIKDTDIKDMTPFFFALPSELKEHSGFFIQLGCFKCIDLNLYIKTLHEIKTVCEAQTPDKICSEERLLKLSIEILNTLHENYMNDLEQNERDIYFPTRIDTTKPIGLKMAPAKQCTYCDAQWLDIQDITDDGIIEIHPKVPIETAEALGVLSLRQQILSNTEAFEEWGQDEPLTRRLRTLLKEGYVDGFTVAKELFQNADDAGAEKLWILYDERENNDAKTNLLSENMANCQGPAIWVYNDAQFTGDDLKNITKLSGATKESDSTKIGKFGLGFCAVYNLTDVPSFISGENLVIFDPHTTFLGKALPGKRPGLRINFKLIKNVNMLKRMRDQFKPFEGIFGCKILDSTPNFKGTLFRFPLRNCGSEISDTVYTPTEVKDLLNMIMDRSSNMFLFNQRVTEIKVFHLSKTQKNPSDLKLLFKANRTITQLLPTASDFPDKSVLKEATERKRLKNLVPPLFSLQKISIIGKRINNDHSDQTEYFDFSRTWLTSWATGASKKCLEMTELENGALCVGAVAVPIEQNNNDSTNFPNLKVLSLQDVQAHFYRKGHVFFFLPLPIEHNFPFHINGQFGVTPDRRHLNSSTDDDKQTKMSDWNKCLLSDSVILALLYLLENIHSLGTLKSYMFDRLWPRSDTGQLLKYVPEAFYQHIVQPGRYKVFEKDGEWFDLSQCVFLEHRFRRSAVGEIAFEALSVMTKHVVDLSEEVYGLLLAADSKLVIERTVNEKAFYLKYFLPKLEYFDKNTVLISQRNELLCHAICLNNVEIDGWLKSNPCIPTLHSGVLKQPKEIIDPESLLSDLFETVDGFFPEKDFCSTAILERLRDFGLVYDKLPDTFVLERARSISELKRRCEICAAIRSSHLLMYLSRKLENHENCISDLKQMEIIPVKSKPIHWPFSWKGETPPKNENPKACQIHPENVGKYRFSHFERPSKVYHFDCKYLVGCSKYIFDERFCLQNKLYTSSANLENALKCIGMKGIPQTDIAHAHVLEQLEYVVYKTFRSKARFEFESAVKAIYKYLDSKCKDKLEFESLKAALHDKACVWIGERFVSPDTVARICPVNCQPYLFELKQSPLFEFVNLQKCLEIADRFDPRFIGGIVMNIKLMKGNDILTTEEVRSVIQLLTCLDRSLQIFKIDDMETILDEEMPCIYGPDEHCVLRDCKSMCLNDSYDIDKSDSMIYAHMDISAGLAKTFGIKPKLIYNLEESSEDIVDFYQEEPLVTRLKRLVEGYPSDSGIFKELIQNADDSGATEIHFLLDFETHPCDNIMNEEFRPLQGPALCVYNNSAFSNQDLKGIQSLGVGSKGEDPSKTGRYGVGFNSVYNITDAPSFYTLGGDIENGETLCIFDPMAKYLPNVKKHRPGKRYKDVRVLKRCHSNVMDGYHIGFFMKQNNTKASIFRFPLRTSEMAKLSEIKNEIVTVDAVSRYLDTFCKEAKDMLVFLKNLRTIKVSKTSRTKSECPYQCFHLNVDMSYGDQMKRLAFVKAQSKLCSEAVVNKEELLQNNQQSFVYEMNMTEEFPMFSNKTKYTVVQTVGFKDKENIPQLLKENLIKGDIGLVPHGGVALPLSLAPMNTQSKIDANCKAFCFLPLPITTGLPVHVHGYFALDHEVRRSLYRSEDKAKCPKTNWNSTLIRQVISPSYVLLLEHTKSQLFKEYSDKTSSLQSVNCLLTLYQQLFPAVENVTDEYWKELLVGVYTELATCYIPFLPVLKTSSVDTPEKFEKITQLSWTPLKLPDCHFPAYYMEESDFNSRKNKKSDFNNLLRDIGLRIVKCDDKIISALRLSGTAIEELKAKQCIEFLTSFSCEDAGKCLLEVNKQIGETVLRSTANLWNILKFCLDDTECFGLHVKRLPLFLTQDCVLRTLPDKDFYYVEKLGRFCDLFPTKVQIFLHSDISSLVALKLKEYENISGQKLKPFSLQEFVKLAMQTDVVKTNSNTNELWDKHSPDVCWLQRFWNFFSESISSKKRENVLHGLQVIKNLALIPVSDGKGNSFLAPPTNIKSLLDGESFSQNSKLHEAILHLKLPGVDRSVLSGAILPMLLDQIPCFQRVADVIENFHLQLNTVSKSEISEIQARCIMRYFNENLKKEEFTGIVKTRLRCLPLFPSRFGRPVAINTCQKTCVVPNDMPENGLEDLATKANILFLQDITCDDLYKHLNIPKSELAAVYTKLVIPNHEKMIRKDFYVHIKFIADDRKLSSAVEIISMLKTTKFVLTDDGRVVYVKDIFDPFYTIFQRMCKPPELVPSDLRDNRILKLFKKLGMKTSMNIELFVRFAECLQTTESENGLTEDVKQISTLITKALLKMNEDFFKTPCCEKLREIRFILPFIPSGDMTSIHPVFNSSRLICFKGSVLPSQTSTCWTVSNILATTSDPTVKQSAKSEIIINALQIERRPPVKDLIRHLKNVCEVFSKRVKVPTTINHDLLQNILAEIYQALEEYRKCNQLTKELLKSLDKVPAIYVPHIKQIMLSDTVVLECRDNEEIQPYLNKCPECFSIYKELFLLLGARKEVSCDTYASVLNALKSDCDDAGKLLPKGQADGVKAMGHFFTALAKSVGEVKISEDTLYLVTKDFRLEKAENLVAVNDFVLYTTVSSDQRNSVSFMLDCCRFVEYTARREMFIESLNNLPQSKRPRLLTDIVRDRIVLDGIRLKDNAIGEEFERFIRSRSFVNGFVRLVKHAWKESGDEWRSEEETRISSHLEKLSFKHAKGIVTILALKPNKATEDEIMVENSSETKNVHLEDNRGNVCVYFNVEYIKWLEDIQTVLSIYLNDFVQKRLKDKLLMTLRDIIGVYKKPGEICVILSKAKVPFEGDFEVEEAPECPAPGEFVPRELHRYLDNDYGVFYHYDYKFVALELDDPALDMAESEGGDEEEDTKENNHDDDDDKLQSTYIFVHILDKVEPNSDLPLMQEFKIDDGSGNPRIVKAFQLFKFIVKAENSNMERSMTLYNRLAAGNDTSPGSGDSKTTNDSDKKQPLTLKQAYAEVRNYLQEAWKQPESDRKKIVKRLLLKWHSDKNPDNITFCTKVFQYIQQCLQRLEKGLNLPDEPEDSAGGSSKSGPSSSSRHWNNSWYNRWWRQHNHSYRYPSGDYNTGSSWEEYTGASTGTGGYCGGFWESWRYKRQRRQTKPEPYHWYSEGRRWLKLAESDLQNGKASLLCSCGYAFNWICFQAHQAAEKSLKAAWYAKDANEIHRVKSSHNIVSIATELSPALVSMAREMFNLVGDHDRMIYPDSWGPLPQEIYTRKMAEDAIKLAQQIIAKVQSDFMG